uniref:L3MBTL histone methyl-lysine binding protein 1 n=1 Tax=Equus caballus TaxID=9796 RepID=F6XWC6_HORSE
MILFTCPHLHGRVGAGPPGSPVSCLSVYLFAASTATLGLSSSALDVSCFPREPIHVGAPERVADSVPVTATVLPQLSAGPAASSSASTVRLLEWTEAAAPPPGSGLRFRISEYAPLNMVGAEQPPSPELRQEGVAEYENGEAPAGGGDAGTHQPADLPQDPPEDPPQDPPEDDGTCQCQACGPQPGTGPDAGSSSDGCPPLYQERSVIVENSSGQNSSCASTSELLKPMKKRKHREYQSPSEEESEPEAMVGRGQGEGRGRLEAVPQFPLSPPLIQVLGLGQRRHIITHILESHPESGPVLDWRKMDESPSCFSGAPISV